MGELRSSLPADVGLVPPRMPSQPHAVADVRRGWGGRTKTAATARRTHECAQRHYRGPEWAGGRSGKPRRILGKSGDSPVPDGEGFPGDGFASQRRECYTCGGARALPASGIPRDSAGKPGSRGCGDGRGDPLPKCDNLGEARYCSTWTVVERSPHRQRMTNI